MKKIKLFFSLLALLIGAGTAIAVNRQPTPTADMLHDWIDWNGQTIFWGMTQQQAQMFCAPAPLNVCLRAKDNVLIYTTGYLPW